jgi:large subunit ribosomal protein L10e
MARLRKAIAYRRLERPYTRISKYREKSFIRGRPHLKIVKFNMGNPNKEFPVKLFLKSDKSLQIRQEAIESARQSANKFLEEKVGKMNYFFRVRMFPHHVLRENPLASGAGADRLSTGMQKAFGKPIGIAAQVKKGKILFEIQVDEKNVELARTALKKAIHKLPVSGIIEIKGKSKAS